MNDSHATVVTKYFAKITSLFLQWYIWFRSCTMPVVYTYIPTSSSFVNVFVFLMSVGFLYIEWHDLSLVSVCTLCNHSSPLSFTLSLPLFPLLSLPLLFPSPFLPSFFLLSSILHVSPLLFSSPPSSFLPSLLSFPLLPPLSPPSSPSLPPQAGANMIVSGTPVSEDVGQWSRLPASERHKQVSLCEAEWACRSCVCDVESTTSRRPVCGVESTTSRRPVCVVESTTSRLYVFLVLH